MTTRNSEGTSLSSCVGEGSDNRFVGSGSVS